MERCKVAKNVTIDGKPYKVVDPQDACASLNKVLAKHEGSQLLTVKEYAAILNAKDK